MMKSVFGSGAYHSAPALLAARKPSQAGTVPSPLFKGGGASCRWQDAPGVCLLKTRTNPRPFGAPPLKRGLGVLLPERLCHLPYLAVCKTSRNSPSFPRRRESSKHAKTGIQCNSAHTPSFPRRRESSIFIPTWRRGMSSSSCENLTSLLDSRLRGNDGVARRGGGCRLPDLAARKTSQSARPSEKGT